MEGLAGEFARFADFFPEALLLVARDGRVQGANRAARDQLLAGAPPDAECTLPDLVADSPEKTLEYVRLCARSRERLPGTLTFRPDEQPETYHCLGARFTSDARHERLVLLRLVPRRESISRFVALKQHIHDLEREIARRLYAETKAEEQRELLHVTLASIGDAVMTTDLRGSITFMNGVAEELSGWREQEAIGRPLEDVFVIHNEHSGAAVESPVGKVLRDGLVVGLANHTVLIRKDGTQLPIDDSGAPIRDGHGRLLGVVLVFHEISERRRMERELESQAEALHEADRRKNEFLAMLAHELRNPLAPLNNGVQILRLQGREANIDRLADMMERQTAQLTRLVDDLLDIARITRGSVRLERAPISLATVIEHALETARPLIDERGHRLSVHLPQETLTLNADLTRLSQVFSNLLNNAAKFMEPGGEITLEAFAEGDRAVVSIRDEGYGMEPELLARTFDLFAQADRSLDRKDGGLGIGLTLVRTLVQMHGGEVSAFSEGRGTGSKFVVSLPLGPK